MTQEQIIEGNKLIAEFMGVKMHNETHIEVVTNAFGTGTSTIHPIEYHSSFDWLMPVVDKIRDMHEINGIAIEEADLESADCHLLSLTIFASLDTVFHEVVQFITWFNTQKQS